ncbi:hypothetical protein ACS5NO_12685 [Larkinella sp. GY13]|uniref:hypothetical protein n=1 Tax=Larkinella sp. GY13 TaxID=3453720 RepID=UPI003EEE1471
MKTFIEVTRSNNQKVMINIISIRLILKHTHTGKAVISMAGQGKQEIEFSTEESYEEVYKMIKEIELI